MLVQQFRVIMSDSKTTFLMLHLVLFNSAFIKAACPEGFPQSLDNLCFRIFNETLTYADAQTSCADIGGRLVEGAEWFKRLSSTDDSIEPWKSLTSIWTGLTDHLDERRKNKRDWQWASGDRATDAEAQWDSDQPNDTKGRQDCVAFIRDSKMSEDRWCNENMEFICEPRPAALERRTQEFKREAVRSDGSAIGEKQEHNTSISLFDCFAACHQKRQRCVSLYYQATTSTCIRILYNDAAIRVDNPATWMKFSGVQ